MVIETVDAFPPELDAIAAESAGATFYHTSVWLTCLAEAFPGLAPRTLLVMDGGEPTGYLPFMEMRTAGARRLWSLPFGTYGGPVAKRPAEAEALLTAFAGMRSEPGIHEIGLIDYHNRWQLHDLKSEVESTHVVDLAGGYDALWSRGFEKSKRRQARKAEREGLEVREAQDGDVHDYYRIYRERADAWGQKVQYPERLFHRLLEIGGESVRLFVAHKESTVVGGHLNFYFRDQVIAWNGVTDEGSRGAQASTLLYSYCMRHACERGFHYYNLGASLGKRSLVQYKEALGGKPHTYRTLRWRSLGGRLASSILRRLPRRLGGVG